MNKWITMALLIGGLLGLSLAGRLHPRLLEMRRQAHLNLAAPLENTPPLVAFTTVALGGFRGLIADILWIRASNLQDDRKYFELVQLADWITKLEPRLTDVWAFHAWNLAYNISVLFPNPADRWRWVRHGISLLRDNGLVYNPGDAGLFYELGWLFQHKIGAAYDQANVYYKKAWAAEMMTLFDGERPDYEELLSAYRSRKELVRNPEIVALLNRLRALGQDPFDPRLLDKSGLSAEVAAELERSGAAAQALLLFLRAQRLRETYKLDPLIMMEVDKEFGPLDWRMPQAHAIYWAYRGRSTATGFDAVALDRMIFQSLGDAFRQGRLFVDAANNLFIPSPNLDLISKVLAAFDHAIQAHPEQDTMKSAKANFLREAVVYLYLYNRQDQARAVLDELATEYPSEEYTHGLESFVLNTFSDRIANISERDAMALVESTAYQSLFWQALGDNGRATGYLNLSKLCWNTYMEPMQDAGVKERIGLPPFDEIRRQALERVKNDLRDDKAQARLNALQPKP